jgi:hypothetical protein
MKYKQKSALYRAISMRREKRGGDVPSAVLHRIKDYVESSLVSLIYKVK